MTGDAGANSITGGGFDVIEGAAGNDVLDGGSDDDALTGGQGDDSLVGGGGADFLYGSAGNDTAVMAGDLGDYTFTATGLRGRTRISGPGDGTDIVVNVESVAFLDGQAAPTRVVTIEQPDNSGFQINTFGLSLGDQNDQAAATLEDGTTLVVWRGPNLAFPTEDGVFGQLLDPDGGPLNGSTQFTILDTIPAAGSDVRSLTVAPLSDASFGDGFVVAWYRPQGVGVPALKEFVVLDADGDVQTPLTATTTTVDVESRLFAVPRANGDFVLGWDVPDEDFFPGDIYVEQISDAGVFQGFNVLAEVPDQFFPVAAPLASGEFVVAWVEGTSTIGARRVDATLNPIGTTSTVSLTSTLVGSEPISVTGLADGGFVVVWGEFNENRGRIGGQRFASDGTPVGTTFLVNDDFGNLTADQSHVAGLADGGFVVSWRDDRDGGTDLNVYFQMFDADGNKVGGNILANTLQSGNQASPFLTAMPDDGFLVTWVFDQGAGGASVGEDVAGQYFDSEGRPVGLVSVIGTPDSDVLRGGDSNERLLGEGGDDSLDGGAGADSLEGGDGNDYLFGGAGGDLLSGGDGIDTADFSDAVQDIVANMETGQVFDGLIASDFIVGIEVLIGGNNNDTFLTASGSETIDAGRGIDTIFASEGDDSLMGGSSVDVAVFGGSAGDYAFTSGSPGTTVVTDGNTADGDQGTDALGGIEQVVFDGATVQLLSAETQVTSAPAGSISTPAVAGLPDGSRLIVWTEDDGVSEGVFCRQHDLDGTPLGDAFRIDSGASTNPRSVSLADIDGLGTVVAWTGHDADAGVDAPFARLFDSDLNPIGAGDIRLDPTDDPHGERTVVANLPGLGGFVAAWSRDTGGGRGVFAQRFDSSGTPLEPEIELSPGFGFHDLPTLSPSDGGGFLVAWIDGINVNVASYDAFASERYTTTGVVSPPGFATYAPPALGVLPDGSALVAWSGEAAGSTDHDIIGARLDPFGNLFGIVQDVQVVTNVILTPLGEIEGFQMDPVFTPVGGGHLLLTWRTLGSIGAEKLGAQRIAPDGLFPERDGGEVRADPFDVGGITTYGAQNLSAAPNQDDGLVSVWSGRGTDGNDGVFFRLFDDSPLTEMDQIVQSGLVVTGEGGNLDPEDTTGDDTLVGGGGDDLIDGRGGPDVLAGGSGDDVL